MRIALAQLNPTVGDIAGNAALVLEAIEQARHDGAQVLITSEMMLLGYPPRDLLQRQGVVEACEQAVRMIARHAGEMYVVVGHPRCVTGGTRPWRNSASVCHRGRVIAVCDKQLLPGYDVFDEDRYFEPGERSLAVDMDGRRVGVVICEDLWRAGDVSAVRRYAARPIDDLAQQPCELILSLNASPFVVGKWQRHLEQLSEVARENNVPVIAVNQTGANDDLVFDGRSVVIDREGNAVEILAAFKPQIKTIDLDLDRGAMQQSSDNTTRLQQTIAAWADPMRETCCALVAGVRDYCRKTGHQRVLLGLSGGIDSALTAAIAAAALGSSNVHGVLMPSRYSSAGSITDAESLARRLRLGSTCTIPIEEAHRTMEQLLFDVESPHAKCQASDGDAQRLVPQASVSLVNENIQARLRGVILMALSNARNALVLATSNKSEVAVGYSTLYGDMCGAIMPLGDLLKTRVYELSRWINANFVELGFEEPPIPESSITKPPSAELRPNQTDQDTLPPYELLDQVVQRYIEQEQSVQTIVDETDLDPALVQRIAQMIDRAQYKRDQAPVILKITGRAFGPGRPMPKAMKSTTCSEAPQSSREGAPAIESRLSALSDST